MPEHNPAENCYCGGPEEIYPHKRGTRRGCRPTTTNPSNPETRQTPTPVVPDAEAEIISERASQLGGSGIRRSPRKDPVGTVRTGSDDRYAVKVDASDHGWYSPDGRRYHHSEVSGLRVVRLDENASERPNAGQETDLHPEPTNLWWRNGEVYVGDPDLGQVWFMNPIGYCDLPEDVTKLVPATDDVYALTAVRDELARQERNLALWLHAEAAWKADFGHAANKSLGVGLLALERERDGAWAKLDSIQDHAGGFHAFMLSPGSCNPDQVRSRAVAALDGIRAVLTDQPVTDREEPARPSDLIAVRREDLERVAPNPVDVIRAASEEPAGETKPRVPDSWSVSIEPGHARLVHIGQPGLYLIEWAQDASWAMFTKTDDKPGHGQPAERQAADEVKPVHMLSIEDVPDEHGPRGMCSCGLWVDSDQDGSVLAIAARWGEHWLRATARGASTHEEIARADAWARECEERDDREGMAAVQAEEAAYAIDGLTAYDMDPDIDELDDEEADHG